MMTNRREVQQTQVEPVAGIWFCTNCGRRIQVITASEYPKIQPFVCVCGASMEPGDEHAQVLDDAGKGSAIDG
jgi:hypothetical protein